jgi:putative hydrolase of the HAD superfamily
MIKVISLDAAHTLMDVNWHPGRFAFESATAFGLTLDPGRAIATYDTLVRGRWGLYREINVTRDRTAGDAFWDELTADWLLDMGFDEGLARDLSALARKRMYTDEAGCFRNYPETIKALEFLRANGYQLVVVSNWDYSLERTLVALGLRGYFSHVFASLEHGVEKPERALFQIVEHQLQIDPERILHVGDNPVDDYQGAKGAGWRAALLDRSLSETQRPRIPTLLHIAEALTWTD